MAVLNLFNSIESRACLTSLPARLRPGSLLRKPARSRSSCPSCTTHYSQSVEWLPRNRGWIRRKMEIDHRVGTNSGTPAISSNSSRLNRNDAPPTFSSRCSTEDVPGIGSMIGERCRSQAKATCIRVLPCAFATLCRVSPATLPDPNGNHGMNAIPFCSQ
jgi:hypothetical protein